LIEIINKQLLLQLVGYLCYWQMGFNSVFKGLMRAVWFERLWKLVSCIQTSLGLSMCRVGFVHIR